VSSGTTAGGIENSYETVEDFLVCSTSKDFGVQLFYFGFAVLFYDVWLFEISWFR